MKSIEDYWRDVEPKIKVEGAAKQSASTKRAIRRVFVLGAAAALDAILAAAVDPQSAADPARWFGRFAVDVYSELGEPPPPVPAAAVAAMGRRGRA